jgi:predicted dehydrogenase
MTKLRVAVIGAGSWGRNHVRSVASLADAELAAVCDLSPKVRDAMARNYPAALVTDDVDAALAAADAVVVATPATSHATLAARAIERGLPVLVGHLLVFHPAVERLKAMIAGGDLGEVYYLYSQRVNLGQVRPDENALWSFGPHDVSVALELLGERPVRVSANGRSYLQPGIEDVVFMTLEFASGVMAHVQMSWLDPHKERRLTVVGSRKMVVFDDMQPREKLRVYDKGVERPPEYASYGESLAIREGDITIPRIPNTEPLGAELRHFVAVARGAEHPRVGGIDGLLVIRILEAASRSLCNGGTAVTLE